MEEAKEIIHKPDSLLRFNMSDGFRLCLLNSDIFRIVSSILKIIAPLKGVDFISIRGSSYKYRYHWLNQQRSIRVFYSLIAQTYH